MSKWKKVKLDDICVKKIQLITSKDDFNIEYIDISSIDNMRKEIISYQTLNSKEAPSRAKQILKKNDILVSTVRPNLNAVAINRIESKNVVVCSTGYCVLRCNDNIEVNYIFNYCKSTAFVKGLIKVARGASYPAVSNSEVRNNMIPLPPLETQKQIAKTLDTAADLLAMRKQQLAELDNLIKSIFYDMFGDPVANEKGWRILPLGELCEITSSKRIFESEYVLEGIPFYRTKEIVELSKCDEVSTELYISSNRYDEIRNNFDIPHKNDILLSAVGTIGTTWIVPNEEPFYFKDGNLLWIKNSSNFDSKYLNIMLSILIKHHTNNLTIGSAYNALTIIKVKQMPSPLPPIDLQTQFAEIVTKIEEQKALVQKAIDEAQYLFDSLMSEYFDE